jgi:ribosomal protein S27E
MTETFISASPDKYQIMLENYALILEKTNQQLGLWSNPYGIMIGILTLLFAIAATVVSIMLVKNSRDMKKRQDDFFTNQEKIVDTNYKNFEKISLERYKKAQDEFEVLINEQKKLLIDTDNSGKTKIEAAIADLKKAKASSGLNFLTPVVTNATWPRNFSASSGLNFSTPVVTSTRWSGNSSVFSNAADWEPSSRIVNVECVGCMTTYQIPFNEYSCSMYTVCPNCGNNNSYNSKYST